MTTSDDEVREATVTMLMNGSQEDRDRFVIATLMDIKTNGCAQRCNDKQSTTIEKWTPAAVLTLIQGSIMAFVEYSRK